MWCWLWDWVCIGVVEVVEEVYFDVFVVVLVFVEFGVGEIELEMGVVDVYVGVVVMCVYVGEFGVLVIVEGECFVLWECGGIDEVV